jgi:membrane protein
MDLREQQGLLRHRTLRVWRFLTEELWEENRKHQRGFRGFLYHQLRVMMVVGRTLPRGQIPLRAAAMTLATLLALVPGIVLVFSLLRAFGGFDQLISVMQHFILDNLVTNAQEDVSSFLGRYFAGARAFQGIGVLFLLGGVFGLLATTEDAFNHIWGIQRGRNLTQRLTVYTTIAVLGPFLLSVSLTMTASLQNAESLERLQAWAPAGTTGFVFWLLPLLVTILGLTLLYWIMPNTRIGVLSAFSGAVIAGLAWEISKWGFGLYLSSANTYRTLYGPLVAIPLLFLWIQLSWVIVLFGALLTFAREAADDFSLEEGAVTAGYRERLKAAIGCLAAIARAHSHGEQAPNVSQLAQELHIPVRLARTAVSDLLGGGLLHEVILDRTRGEGGLVPARDLQHLSVYDVIACMQSAGTTTPASTLAAESREAERILAEMDALLANLGRPISFARIIEAVEGQASDIPAKPSIELVDGRNGLAIPPGAAGG